MATHLARSPTRLYPGEAIVISEGLRRNAFPPSQAVNWRNTSQPKQIPQFALDDDLTVVLFAGLGGACQGLEEAGCPVNVANNHNDVALAAHAAIHPHTKHVKGSIFDVDPLAATTGKMVKVIWGSPDCRNHSAAAGGAPRSPAVRSLPWQFCRWAAKTRPKVMFVENVPQIRAWGPLVAKRCKLTGRVIKLDGSVAALGERVPVQQQHLIQNPKQKGRVFRKFVGHLEQLGGVYEDRDLVCADFGVPTTRKRYFAIVRFDGEPISWPQRTHAPVADAKRLRLKPYVPSYEIIDWSLPIPSIFGRKKELAPATLRRIAIGLRRHVLGDPDPFLVHLTHAGDRAIHPLSGPLPTLTCANRGEIALVAPKFVKLDGNQIIQEDAVIAPWVVMHNLGMVGHPIRGTLPTLTTAGTQVQIAAAYLVKLRGTSTTVSIREPLPTFSAGGNHILAVAAILERVAPELVERDEFGALKPLTMQINGDTYAIVDVGMRMLEPFEAARAHELELPKAITVNGFTRPLTKTEAMRLIGNSVPKRMARLLADANQAHLLYRQPSEQRLAG